MCQSNWWIVTRVALYLPGYYTEITQKSTPGTQWRLSFDTATAAGDILGERSWYCHLG
jgi:hypothetical protein